MMDKLIGKLLGILEEALKTSDLIERKERGTENHRTLESLYIC